MSYEQFLSVTDEDTHAEWVDGKVIFFMPPGTRHQEMVTFLVTLLGAFVRHFGLGKLLTAPYEMKLSPEGSAREPDILFVATERLDRLTEQRLAGPADLVVEVISPESVARDRSEKFYEYQEAGVREYWLIDPRPGRQRADFWVLDDSGQYSPALVDEDGVYRSTVLPNFWLNVDWLLVDDLPDPIQSFLQITNLRLS
jgi:Uma2 family endonuclease